MNEHISVSKHRQWLLIFSIIFAGEMIFSLPFHLARFFRPTFLESFQLTNTELGDIFAFYGIVAMLAYFPGGYLADRFSAKKLMAGALFATALGGLYLSTFPNQNGLMMVFAYWGLTTILCFWSAMIKLTRDIASHEDQGKAFGLLDGGRGFVAASMATLAVTLVTLFFPGSMETLSAQERLDAMLVVIYLYSALTLLAGLIIMLVIPEQSNDLTHSKSIPPAATTSLKSTLSNKVVWFQAGIVLAAYCGFKGLDYFGLYLVKVFNYNEIRSSELIAYSSYVRPLAAIVAGALADKLLPTRVLKISFLLVCFSYALFSMFSNDISTLFLFGNLLFCFVLVFSMRAIYFALIEQADIASNQTGVSVGLISVIGFTPDIFFAPLAGRLLDHPDSAMGFKLFFMTLITIAIIGLIATLLLSWQLKARIH